MNHARELLDHTATSVLLYLQETFTFRVLTPQASVPLTYPAAKGKKKSDFSPTLLYFPLR